MAILLDLGSFRLDGCMESVLKSLNNIAKHGSVDGSDFSGDGCFQFLKTLWIGTISFVLEISLQEKIARIQIWTVWRLG